MFATVLLLNGFQRPLTYKIPEELEGKIGVGSLIKVPLKTSQHLAYVVQIDLNFYSDFNVREILGLQQFPDDVKYAEFIEKISKFYFVPSLHFYQRIRGFFADKKAQEAPLYPGALPDGDPSTSSGRARQPNSVHPAVSAEALCEGRELDSGSNRNNILLTFEQQNIVDYLKPLVKNPDYKPTLIHGVTGSGKTEVYSNLIQECIDNNKSVLLLLPEVSLSLQFERIFQKKLPNTKVIGFHSASKPSDRRALWNGLLKNEPALIIGVHMPIMLPINNLGLIIIDEEHEHGFLEKKHPRLNSKEIAIWRASIYKIPILLGSATPSLSSLHNVQAKGWKIFNITKRFAGSFPEIKKVILKSQKDQRRSNFWVSRELETAIRDCLSRKEQAIIYLNRRGYSFFVQCKDCGHVFQCANCSVSLTLHAHYGQETLRCHYCDFQKPLPAVCPDCKSDQKNFLKKGVGTQQAVKIFQELFPTAIIARADLDTTSQKRSWYQTVEDFEQGKIDILIGTQTITKGYHFPRVTLVGVLWADLNLHMPIYNAAETSIQQLIQVAGRAGRGQLPSTVIIQMMKDHKIFDYLNEIDYLKFCEDEAVLRKEICYPPFGRLVQIEIKNSSDIQLDKDADSIAQILNRINDSQNLQIQVLGPAQPMISKIQNVEIRQIFLKSQTFSSIHKLLSQIDFDQFDSRVFIVSSQ
ncbi:MAG: primosomal protein N' [bacterium]